MLNTVLNNERDIDNDDLLDDEDTQKDRYLTFRLAEEEYAVEIRFVTEIIGIQRITEVPDVDAFIKGVINLRGKIIPVIDVRLRFHLEPKVYGDRTCIIVVDMNGTSVGLIVDEVSEVLLIPEANVSEPPKTTKGSQSRYIQGIGRVGENVKIILHINRLLSDEELEQITQ
jgi:purine-binding chemotaxis protein CheW